MLLKYVRLKGNLKYEPKESCDNFSLPGLENPTQIPASIAGKLQQELLLLAAVSDRPNTTSEKMTVSSRHRYPLDRGGFSFDAQTGLLSA
jgi:hypothetical protein